MSAPNFCTMKDFSLFAFISDDELELYEVSEELQQRLDAMNRELVFHKVEVQNGYYYGIQLYAEAEHDLNEENYTNDDCRYYFDLCRSVTYRRFEAEKRKINRLFRAIAKEYGLEELVCTGRFSNGEAVYSPVCSRSRLYAAVNM